MDKIKILVVKPGKRPVIMEIDHTLQNLQVIVGGYITATYPWDDPVALVCDDEAFLKPNELNRMITPDLIIAGTFFICGLTEDDFGSLSDELLGKYKRMFAEPETFIRIENKLICMTGSAWGDKIKAVITL